MLIKTEGITTLSPGFKNCIILFLISLSFKITCSVVWDVSPLDSCGLFSCLRKKKTAHQMKKKMKKAEADNTTNL